MCCRFYIDKESPEMQTIIAQMNRSPLMQRWPSTQSEAFALDVQTSSLQASFPHFVVLTREPADSIRFIHDRMPVIVSVADRGAWLLDGALPRLPSGYLAVPQGDVQLSMDALL